MAKEVVPNGHEYVAQAHAISRAAYRMPVMLRRLIFLVMAQVRPGDNELPEVEMKVGDIARALGLGHSGNTYAVIRGSIIDALKQVIEIDHEGGGWEAYTWLIGAAYYPDTDSIALALNGELKPFILHLQKAFSKISIADISKLQSRHALRIFEIIMSRKGQANKKGEWFAEVEIGELRVLLKLGPNEYQRTDILRRQVIDYPVREINDAELGIHIETQYIRRGKFLHAVRFNCVTVKRGEPRPVGPATPEEVDEEKLINEQRERYDEILDEVRQQMPLPFAAGRTLETAHHVEAIKRLREEMNKKKLNV
jgi:plasmid replication initiation protein